MLKDHRHTLPGILFPAILLAAGCSVHAAEYWVAPDGSDDAPGSRARPFRTLQKAAEAMEPGDRCRVRGGTYREWIKPPRGGESDAKRITYVAEPGEEVILKGSERITSWVRQTNGFWKVELPDSFFGSFNPYKTNLSGGWLRYGKELHLGMVYLDGEPLRERLKLEEVGTTAFAFCIEDGAHTTILYANFGNADPNARLAEINVRECIFFPTVKGLKYITVDGFTMRHAAANWACFRAFQHAALGTYWGSNWIIQNCRVSDARCVGIVCGNDPSSENAGFDVESTGHHIVRNNLIQRCGEAGIHGFKGWACSVIENNLIEDINPWNEFGGFETGGIKLHDPVDVIIRNNVVRRVRAGEGQFAGIWLDWGAQGTRVTGNVVYDLTALPLFVQNTHGGPILIDNNIFSGRVRTTAENVVFVHNLFVNCPQSSAIENFQGVYWEPHRGRPVAVTRFLRQNNRFFNNLFTQQGMEQVAEAPGFQSDWNVFYRGAKKSAWGDAQHSLEVSFDPDVQFTSLPNGVEITFRADRSPGNVQCPLITRDWLGTFPLTGQGIEYHDGSPITIDQDILSKPRNKANPTAGPVENPEEGANVVRLIVGPKNASATPPKRLEPAGG